MRSLTTSHALYVIEHVRPGLSLDQLPSSWKEWLRDCVFTDNAFSTRFWVRGKTTPTPLEEEGRQHLIEVLQQHGYDYQEFAAAMQGKLSKNRQAPIPVELQPVYSELNKPGQIEGPIPNDLTWWDGKKFTLYNQTTLEWPSQNYDLTSIELPEFRIVSRVYRPSARDIEMLEQLKRTFGWQPPS